MAVIDQLLADARRRHDLPSPAVRRQLREQVGLSQQDLADALGIGRTAVTRWETGARAPGRAVRLAYIELLERLAAEGERHG